MKILLSYLEIDTLCAMEQDLNDGLFFAIDRHPKRQHGNRRRPDAIRRRLTLVQAEFERRSRKGD